MNIGRSVLIYSSASKFEVFSAAIVTGEYPDVVGLVDVESFHKKSSSFAHTHPIEGVMLVNTPEEAREAWSNGQKYVAFPYDPADPVGLVDKATPPTSQSKKK